MSSSVDHKNPERVAAGLKSAINNPNVSEEAKERAVDRLDHMGEKPGNTQRTQRQEHGDHDTNRVLGGYKATLSNENTSPEAKQHAREILEAHGYTVERAEGVTEDEHQVRVLAGYKAALNNPRVSSEAKTHAREFLASHGAL